MMRGLVLLATAVVLVLASSCGKRGVRVVVNEPFPKALSSWRLFTGELRRLTPNAGVVPYELNTPLFSDYAEKSRFVWMPAGMAAEYRDAEVFEFPRGTVIAKTFSYADRRVETRLLVNGPDGWVALPYVWNAAQTEATLEIAADPIDITYEHPSAGPIRIHYVVPNQNQCKGCHERSKQLVPIGPKARHLNREFDYAGGRENQLAYWSRVGYLKGAPEAAKVPRNAVWDDAASGPVEARARAYLDANCAHCHNPEGPANTSGLYYGAEVTDPLRLGFCKVPVAAGRGAGDLRFDVMPGRPDESILIRRLESLEPKVMMPELGRASVHREGARLLREWISAARDSSSCAP